MKLLVVGSIGFDTVETPGGKSERALGGTAVYFSMAASYFTRVGMVAAVGTDFPEEYVQLLRQKGVDLSGLMTLKGETFHWGGKYHADMNSRDTLFTHLNVFKDFQPQVPAAYRNTPFIFLGNIDPSLQLHVLEQIDQPRLVALDTMNYWIDGTPEALKQVLSHIDLLFVNDEEARQLSGEISLIKAARKIQQMGPKMIIVKKGEHGALLIREQEIFFAPAYPLETVKDPTGAGDTFAGGFMGYLAKANAFDEMSLRRAMIYGSTLASFAVEDFSIENLKCLE
ncbi:MAG: sugar kinase, partial [Calditrichaeota bacterium]